MTPRCSRKRPIPPPEPPGEIELAWGTVIELADGVTFVLTKPVEAPPGVHLRRSTKPFKSDGLYDDLLRDPPPKPGRKQKK
jgi:hypothetical protein